jgi:CBS domain-containing protein
MEFRGDPERDGTMICPTCSYDNLPGSEVCESCLHDLTQLDQPMAQDRVQRSLMEDPVNALRPQPPITVTVDTPVRDAVRTMIDSNIGALLVLDSDGNLAGIFTERDLLQKGAGLIELSDPRPVKDLMTVNPETVRTTDNLAFVLHKMDIGGYRHLPVMEKDKVVGVISVRDMLRHFTRLCNH